MKINIAVFFGCSSVEHEVSVISGVQAMMSLDRTKYDVTPIYVTKNGDFLTGDALFDITEYKNIPALTSKCRKVTFVRENDAVVMKSVKKGLFSKEKDITIDFALPVVHGTNCEDGTIQGYFEFLGLPYGGCDVLSSAVGMDKSVFKRTVAADSLPVLKGVSVTARMWIEDRESAAKRIEKEIGYPVIVKPVNLGSSVGISKVETPEELDEAVDLAFSFSDTLLIEHAVTNLREINCSVLGDRDECVASVCEEPIMQDKILSYKDKYMSGGKSAKSGGSKGMTSLQRKLPAELSEEKSDEIRQIARKTFACLGCCGVVRIDFLLDCDDNDKVYINEINTIPGSLAFYLWEATGMKYPELLDRIINLGFKRARKRANLMFTIDTNLLSSAGNLGGAKGAKGGNPK